MRPMLFKIMYYLAALAILVEITRCYVCQDFTEFQVMVTLFLLGITLRLDHKEPK